MHQWFTHSLFGYNRRIYIRDVFLVHGFQQVESCTVPVTLVTSDFGSMQTRPSVALVCTGGTALFCQPSRGESEQDHFYMFFIQARWFDVSSHPVELFQAEDWRVAFAALGGGLDDPPGDPPKAGHRPLQLWWPGGPLAARLGGARLPWRPLFRIP